MASYSPQEKQYFDQLFSIVDKDNAEVLPGQDVLPFLLSSSLPQQILGEVWALADPDNNGFLTKDGWYRAARLIGWAQKGSKVEEGLLSNAGPLPTFQGHPLPPVTAQSTGAGHGSTNNNVLPTLTAADRTKFTRIFVGCGPQNGLVSGDKARDVFVKSQLSYDKLGQIWNLSDTQQRGSLDLSDFIIGMYLIQGCMANPSIQLPAILPPGTYEQASGGRAPPNVVTSPVSRQNTGNAPSPIRAQYTGGGSVMQPQRTGQNAQIPGTPPRAFPPTSSNLSASWDVTPDAKATSDRFFTQLDTQGRGTIDGDVAVPFMLQSQLDEGSLASIWDLADIRHEGKLTRDEFAVAMYLINTKLAGQEIPQSLPTSLIPPSLRDAAGSQEIMSSGPSNMAKDLFDLDFDDTPPPIKTAQQPPSAPPAQPSIQSSPFLPQPPSRRGTQATSRSVIPAATQAFGPASQSIRSPQASDLLGDDSVAEQPVVPDNSADVGNKRNQLENTNRGLEDLEISKIDLERSAASSSAELTELESKLSAARSRHETESKAVEDLRNRVSEQSSQVKKLNAEFIGAESDLSAMRSEKDELEQALLRDKEEVRQLQKRMKEVEEEKIVLKTTLEKLRKDARQQKGMLSIAKKQLSTVEGSRDGTRQDVEKAEGELATARQSGESGTPAPFSPSTLTAASGVPLPGTPQAMSPAPTGASQRSKNPFDMLRGTPRPASPASEGEGFATSALMGATAVVGAAAGAVVAGAESLVHAAHDVISPARDGNPEFDENSNSRSPNQNSPPHQVDLDPFGASSAPDEVDPFGAPPNKKVEHHAPDGFGDSFEARSVLPTPANNMEAKAPLSTFDSAFADFDEPVLSSTMTGGLPVGIPKSAVPADLRPDVERTTSTQAVPPSSRPQSPVVSVARSPSPVPPSGVVGSSGIDAVSSDEEDGPEDLERPQPYNREMEPAHTVPPIAPALPVLSSPVGSSNYDMESSKTRRSAPPPPAVRNQYASPTGGDGDQNDFDPFGVPQTTLPTRAEAADTGNPPKNAQFDDEDDFDFSDLPPARVETISSNQPHSSVPSNFDDEFTGFDDDFEKPSSQLNSGSDNSNLTKSYEMVSPQAPSQQETAPTQQRSQSYDEWGFGGNPESGRQTAAPPQSAMSFDDAFGGDFSAPQHGSQYNNAEIAPAQYAPPAGPPPSHQTSLSPPSLPVRRDSQPQQDDLEDVKKLCGMGFSRPLVIDALEANNYDFQKTLNVLIN